jgi:hypothetical protein
VTSKLCIPLTVKQVAKALGWSRVTTWRTLKRLDGELMGMLLKNVGTKRKPRFTVTLEKLQMVAPQWFVDEDFADRLVRVEEGHKNLLSISKSLHARVTTLEKAA